MRSLSLPRYFERPLLIVQFRLRVERETVWSLSRQPSVRTLAGLRLHRTSLRENESRQPIARFQRFFFTRTIVASVGAGDGIRTRDFHLGKVTLYHWVTPASNSYYTKLIGKMQQFLDRKIKNLFLEAKATLHNHFLCFNNDVLRMWLNWQTR